MPPKLLLGLSRIRLELGVSQIGASFHYFLCTSKVFVLCAHQLAVNQPPQVVLQLRVGSSSLSKFVLVLSINARACTPCPPQTFEFVSKKLTFFCCTLSVCLCETMFLLFFQSYYDFAIPKTIIKVWASLTGGIINFLIEQKVKLLSCHSMRDVCAQFVFLFASLTILSLRLSSLSQRNSPLFFFHQFPNTT